MFCAGQVLRPGVVIFGGAGTSHAGTVVSDGDDASSAEAGQEPSLEEIAAAAASKNPDAAASYEDVVYCGNSTGGGCGGVPKKPGPAAKRPATRKPAPTPAEVQIGLISHWLVLARQASGAIFTDDEEDGEPIVDTDAQASAKERFGRVISLAEIAEEDCKKGRLELSDGQRGEVGLMRAAAHKELADVLRHSGTANEVNRNFDLAVKLFREYGQLMQAYEVLGEKIAAAAGRLQGWLEGSQIDKASRTTVTIRGALDVMREVESEMKRDDKYQPWDMMQVKEVALRLVVRRFKNGIHPGPESDSLIAWWLSICGEYAAHMKEMFDAAAGTKNHAGYREKAIDAYSTIVSAAPLASTMEGYPATYRLMRVKAELDMALITTRLKGSALLEYLSDIAQGAMTISRDITDVGKQMELFGMAYRAYAEIEEYAHAHSINIAGALVCGSRTFALAESYAGLIGNGANIDRAIEIYKLAGRFFRAENDAARAAEADRRIAELRK